MNNARVFFETVETESLKELLREKIDQRCKIASEIPHVERHIRDAAANLGALQDELKGKQTKLEYVEEVLRVMQEELAKRINLS